MNGAEIIVDDDNYDLEEVRNAPLVRSMRVKELFGRYSYNIRANSSTTPPVILLYGDNGSGKTTILNLLWNLLSPAPNRRHRTRLARTPFRDFAVTLSNGDTILAHKTDELVGNLEISVSNGRKLLLKQFYPLNSTGVVDSKQVRLIEERLLVEEVGESGQLVEVESEIAEPRDLEDQYIKYLSLTKVYPYFLADNRRFYSDSFKLEEDPPNYEMFLRWQREKVREAAEPADSSLAAELADALRRTSSWLRRQVISGTAQGSQGADAIYLQVLSQLVGPAAHMVNESPSIEHMGKRIEELAVRSKQFSEFGLVPSIQSEPFLELLGQADPERVSIIEDVLSPYLDGQRARLDFLQQSESLIRTFVETVNSFLVNKRLIYNLQRGFRIRADDGTVLSPNQLSSGERQLLLLLCNSLLSRNESALFIIDEPEISLNAKWQRKLIPALLACVQTSNVQFILATHSVEIITGHREFLARLQPRSKRPNA
jgi:energy-coupling factor transporter ATP-binding protein EcfA2